MQPPISIEQFFVMTKVKFMDELTAPRRSTHPSQQPIRQARSPDDIPLSDYVTAMGMDVPQLILFSRVSKDLQAWVEKSKADFAQAEDEAAKITPELFTEYSRADEEGRAELLVGLHLSSLRSTLIFS
jgi:kinetochore protein Spc7/SPC105